MRLLRTAKIELEEFSDNRIPPYAIFSHTWGDNEVTYQDLQNHRACMQVTGYEKVKNCCSVAAAHGFEFVWIDTCCIDKTSSAELSEAINSMYRWYQDAEVCFAYLTDTPFRDPYCIGSEFARSRWFTRGWTLQELIAPSNVIFLAKDWQVIGTKSTLKELLSEITRVPVDILLGADLDGVCVAQKMSWASKRETTRKEDIAYCLMGIFCINMPMLYGEGERAFIRLQEEIMRTSNDHSIFAWKAKSSFSSTDIGILATSPAAFIDSSDIVRHEFFSPAHDPFTLSSKGVHLKLPLIIAENWGECLGILNCERVEKKDIPLAIRLRHSSSRGGKMRRVIMLNEQYFSRDQSHEIVTFNKDIQKIYLECQVESICIKHQMKARYGMRRGEWKISGNLESTDGNTDYNISQEALCHEGTRSDTVSQTQDRQFTQSRIGISNDIVGMTIQIVSFSDLGYSRNARQPVHVKQRFLYMNFLVLMAAYVGLLLFPFKKLR